MKNAWNNLQGVPATFADGTDADTWNTTTQMRTALNHSASYLFNAANVEGYDFGTMTNGKVCIYDSGNTEIDCDTTMTTDTNANTICAGTNVYLDGEGNCDTLYTDTYNTTTQMRAAVNISAYYLFTSADSNNLNGKNLGTLTDTKVCTYDLANTEIDCATTMTVDTNTNAATICTGTTTYLDGEGNCDDLSSVYLDAANDVVNTETDEYLCSWEATGSYLDCDTATDGSGACSAGALCTGGHTHADAEIDDDHTVSSGTDKDISALDGLVKACDGGTCTAPTNNVDGWLYSETGIETDGVLDIDGTSDSNIAGDLAFPNNKGIQLGAVGCIYTDGSKIIIGACP
jgi:hypothetical protein